MNCEHCTVKRMLSLIYDELRRSATRDKVSNKFCHYFVSINEQLRTSNVPVFQTAFNINQANLKSLHKDHFKAAKALEDVTNEMEECIDCILRCMNVIMWLREELKGEIIQFVDFGFSLAMDI